MYNIDYDYDITIYAYIWACLAYRLRPSQKGLFHGF